MTDLQIALIVIWSVIILGSILVEIFLTGYLFLINSLSAIAPLVLAIIIKEPLWILGQVLIFGATWIVIFLLFWKVFKIIKFFNKNKPELNSIVGKNAILLTDSFRENFQDFEYGYLKVDGIKYRTVNYDENHLTKGTLVKIVKLEGNRLFIKHV